MPIYIVKIMIQKYSNLIKKINYYNLKMEGVA
jgi:hypothetical protein